ncbi:hypothetical protein ACFWVP_30585 [Streptomyces sp. NPDC058637]|uniref:hypothetical protein n=1 Tax=Streptomyces sp. NPDC058637 TaxID=3346569 RepID=UPI0036468D05
MDDGSTAAGDSPAPQIVDPTRGTNPGIKIPGTAFDIAAGADGTVWRVNAGGHVYWYTGEQPS